MQNKICPTFDVPCGENKGFCVLLYLPKVFRQTSLSKQYRPRSDATECGIWSGPALFATHPTIGRSSSKMVLFIYEYFKTSTVRSWCVLIEWVDWAVTLHLLSDWPLWMMTNSTDVQTDLSLLLVTFATTDRFFTVVFLLYFSEKLWLGISCESFACKP